MDSNVFLTTNTGSWHWAIHYRAGDNRPNCGGAWVYLLNGEMVIADSVRVRQGRGRGRTAYILHNIQGAPKAMPTMNSLTELNRLCKPTGKTLRQVVFGEVK